MLWWRVPTLQQHCCSSPHSPFDIDTHHERERRCNFRSEDVPYLGLLHEVAQAVPSAGRTRARTSCCLRRRDGKECRLYTHNCTKALIRHLHKASYYIIHPRRFARNASCERSCFWRITTKTPEKVVAVAIVHHISRATARADPSKHVGGLMGRAERPI